MNSVNHQLCLCFILWLHFYGEVFCKNALKNNATIQPLPEFQNLTKDINDEPTPNDKTNQSYLALNDLGVISDHRSQFNRNLVPDDVINLAEITSEIDQAKRVTNHFVVNIYLQIRSFLNTPSGICIFVIVLFLGLLIVAKIFLASNLLKKRHETPNNENRALKKGNLSEDMSRNNYLSAFQEEKSGTYKTANSHMRKSFNNLPDFKLNVNYSATQKKGSKKPASEKNFKTTDDQTDNFHDFSQTFEEDVDLLIKDIDLEDQNCPNPHENQKALDRKINILGQQIILSGKPKNRSVKSCSENNENDFFYDMQGQENFFGDCNLSEIHKLNK